MSTRIERDIAFDSAVHFAGGYYISQYYITLSMLVQTDNIVEQNKALERILHFSNTTLHNTLFINQSDTDAICKYKNAGMRVAVMPDDPYDQIVSMTLLQKFNAITEGRLHVTDCTLGSSLGDGVRFCTVQEASENAMDSAPDLWWNSNNLCTENLADKMCAPEKIVHLFSDDAWETLGLTFEKKKGKKANKK